MTLVVAHRGASRAETENTLAAFRRAGEMGADGVELDVRRAADDRLVVHHDALLHDGRVIRDTRSIDLPADIPTLPDALDACAGMFVNIEVKNDPSEPDFDQSDWVATHVAAELVRRGSDRRWLISSFRLETVDRFRRVLPSARTAWLVTDADADVIRTCAAAGHAAVHPRVDHVTRESVRAAHAAGLVVTPWTCDDPVRIRELIGWGIDGICTNVPDTALAIRADIST
jgi:glycerophosphoryl diester phosphodiesterase